MPWNFNFWSFVVKILPQINPVRKESTPRKEESEEDEKVHAPRCKKNWKNEKKLNKIGAKTRKLEQK